MPNAPQLSRRRSVRPPKALTPQPTPSQHPAVLATDVEISWLPEIGNSVLPRLWDDSRRSSYVHVPRATSTSLPPVATSKISQLTQRLNDSVARTLLSRAAQGNHGDTDDDGTESEDGSALYLTEPAQPRSTVRSTTVVAQATPHPVRRTPAPLGPPLCASVPTASRQITSNMREPLQQSTRVADDGDELHAYLATANPRSYVSQRIGLLRKDAAMYKRFDDTVATMQRERATRSHGGKSFIKHNVAAVRGATKESVRRERRAKADEHAARVVDAQRRHEVVLGDFVERAERDSSDRRDQRHAKYAEAWFPIAALAARTHFMGMLKIHRDEKLRLQRWGQAAVVIQRHYRMHMQGRVPMTCLRGFLVRARFLKRVLTRVRVRLRHTYTDRLCGVFKQVHGDMRNIMALIAMRRFIRRAKVLQRRWRARVATRVAGHALRVKQWDRVAGLRIVDLNAVIQRAKASDVSPQLRDDAARAHQEQQDLRNMDTAIRDRLLRDCYAEYEAKHLEELALHTAAVVEIRRRNPRAKELPPRPRLAQPLPDGSINGLIKAALREMRAM